MHDRDAIPFYLKKLRDDFEARTRRRPNYSLRAYARFLEVEAPSLSNVLKGKRRLPKAKAATVAEKLNLAPSEQRLFLESNKSQIDETNQNNSNRKKLDSETHFKIISEWEHYAILSLMETKKFKSDLKWVSDRLGISELRASICIGNLLEAELIQLEKGCWILLQSGLRTTEDIPSQALRRARKQDLDLALNAIDEISLEFRDFSSCTTSLNLEDLLILKNMIRDFRKRFMKKCSEGQGQEVYKLSIQLFPLTKLRSSHESN